VSGAAGAGFRLPAVRASELEEGAGGMAGAFAAGEGLGVASGAGTAAVVGATATGAGVSGEGGVLFKAGGASAAFPGAGPGRLCAQPPSQKRPASDTMPALAKRLATKALCTPGLRMMAAWPNEIAAQTVGVQLPCALPRSGARTHAWLPLPAAADLAALPEALSAARLRRRFGAGDDHPDIRWSSSCFYCRSKTITLSVFSPCAEVSLVFEVSSLPSLDTVRVVVPTVLPALFKLNDAVRELTCLPDRLS
jgi:hypothetical protein